MIPDTVGILPPGALGVSFFYHLTQRLETLNGNVFFVGRRGSASAKSLQASGLAVRTPAGIQRIEGRFIQMQLVDDYLPEVLIICPNPDQVLEVITDIVELLIELYALGKSWNELPLIVLSSNGIYYQRVRQIFIEKLEEGTLFGRLPDLWPEAMPQLVGRLLRGVTLQTGLRQGSGANTIYAPGPNGLTRVSGGELRHRERVCSLMNQLGSHFEVEARHSATRLEFDKALVNLSANLLGQLYAIDQNGQFQMLRVGEIFIPEHLPEIRELVEQVFRVGRAMNAYTPDDDAQAIYEHLLAACKRHRDHIPSSLQWVNLNLQKGTLAPELTPTEAWLVEPLRRFALAAGLEGTAAYFESFRYRLVVKLKLAIAVQK